MISRCSRALTSCEGWHARANRGLQRRAAVGGGRVAHGVEPVAAGPRRHERPWHRPAGDVPSLPSGDASAPPDEPPDVPAAAEPRIGRPVVRLAAIEKSVGRPRTRHDLRVIDTESFHWRWVTTAPRPRAPWLAMPRVERRPSRGPNVQLTDADGRWLAPRASTCVDAVSRPGARDQDDTA